MLSRARICLLAGLVLPALLLLAPAVQAQGKANFNDVSFKSFDGVELKGNLYPRAGGNKRDGVALLLHNFDLKKGGNSQQAGWTDLAEKLQAEGYTVLMFDFRGFGGSINVSPDFWTHPHNTGGLIRGSIKKGQTIDHKNFGSAYLPNLVHDIAAAKAYLDRRNDAKELNSSSVVVIGAGSGAALGAAWLANECSRRRDTNVPPQRFGPSLTNQAEISDIACAVWLSISPTLGTKSVGNQLSGWVRKVGKENKVPMAFIYGDQDTKSKQFAQTLISVIEPDPVKRKKYLPNTVSYPVKGVKLAGNELLKTTDLIRGERAPLIKDYLDPVFAERGTKEQKDRRSEQSAYWYVWPNGKPRMINKKGGQESPQVDLKSLNLVGG
jgi:hypothetical protein